MSRHQMLTELVWTRVMFLRLVFRRFGFIWTFVPQKQGLPLWGSMPPVLLTSLMRLHEPLGIKHEVSCIIISNAPHDARHSSCVVACLHASLSGFYAWFAYHCAYKLELSLVCTPQFRLRWPACMLHCHVSLSPWETLCVQAWIVIGMRDTIHALQACRHAWFLLLCLLPIRTTIIAIVALWKLRSFIMNLSHIDWNHLWCLSHYFSPHNNIVCPRPYCRNLLPITHSLWWWPVAHGWSLMAHIPTAVPCCLCVHLKFAVVSQHTLQFASDFSCIFFLFCCWCWAGGTFLKPFWLLEQNGRYAQTHTSRSIS